MREGSQVVAVVGGSGFVGRAVVARLGAEGVDVRAVTAPRLTWWPHRDADYDEATVHALAAQLAGARAVVNAAGQPDGTAPASPELFGANALLPALVARASALVGVDRFVHVSSAAVQGRGVLDETSRVDTFSPYSRSKALGERLLAAGPRPFVIFRPTWVHDVGRPNTEALIRLARSPLSCVAGDGEAPTPQVLIGDVAAACAYLTLAPEPVPPIVLQPPSGMTTGLLMRLLGGREPRHLPQSLAGCLAGAARATAPLSRRANAVARRMEMVLFGHHQVPGWLADRKVVAPLDTDAWRRLDTVDVDVPSRAST